MYLKFLIYLPWAACQGPLSLRNTDVNVQFHLHVVFFNQYTVSPSYPQVLPLWNSTNYGSRTVFSTCDWESMDLEGQLYLLFYAVLYKGLEHLLVLVFKAG